mmetsp:Transcript_1031/g.1944  ORF Transcript_1031/g.1944 Transcript_1031/m.1944 type:complete len:128 (-) Transcript_1031:350-733(-)
MPLPRIIKKLDDRTRASLSHRYLTNSPFDRCDESGWSIRASGNRTHEGGGKQTYLQKMSISDSIVLDLVGPSSSPKFMRVETCFIMLKVPCYGLKHSRRRRACRPLRGRRHPLSLRALATEQQTNPC